jgi:nucleoside-diphosphate kinase
MKYVQEPDNYGDRKAMFSLFAAALFSLITLFSSSVYSEEEMIQRTLSIIKPDAVTGHHIGEIIQRFERNQLHVVGMKMVHVNRTQAKYFYFVHRERPFYEELVDYMTSGPIVVLVLEGRDAIARNREIMGAKDPRKAAAGTLRAELGESIGQNAIHGSDSLENAEIEIEFFFQPGELF